LHCAANTDCGERPSFFGPRNGAGILAALRPVVNPANVEEIPDRKLVAAGAGAVDLGESLQAAFPEARSKTSSQAGSSRIIGNRGSPIASHHDLDRHNGRPAGKHGNLCLSTRRGSSHICDISKPTVGRGAVPSLLQCELGFRAGHGELRSPGLSGDRRSIGRARREVIRRRIP